MIGVWELKPFARDNVHIAAHPDMIELLLELIIVTCEQTLQGAYLPGTFARGLVRLLFIEYLRPI